MDNDTADSVRAAIWNWTATVFIFLLMVSITLQFMGWCWHRVRKAWTVDPDGNQDWRGRAWGGGYQPKVDGPQGRPPTGGSVVLQVDGQPLVRHVMRPGDPERNP